MKIFDMTSAKKAKTTADVIAVEELKAALTDYKKEHDFKVGDIVQIKNICGAPMTIPEPGKPAIVVETGVFIDPQDLEPQTHGVNDIGLERSLRIGVIEEGLLVTFLVDPQRFEPYAG